MPKVYTGGELLDNRYFIDKYLDEGGMQEVYLATDSVFNRKIVIKVPKNESAVKRFKRSAVLSSRVSHPNVAKTFDYFEFNSIAHLVEEYLDGGNLSDSLLNRVEVVDPHLVARFLNYVAKGIAAAHHADVVHRDLKPSNIMLQGNLRGLSPKITDFGVARMAQESVAAAVEGGKDTMTSSKTAVGLIPYMAPELISRPRDIRQPSDIWSIGAVGFEMLSGEKPFGDGWMAISRIMGTENVALPSYIEKSRDFKGIGREVFEILQMCMNRDENERVNADQLVELTSKLCYGTAPRRWGTVSGRRFKTGFITSDDGERVFFHADCVYGPLPNEDDRVLFASYPGTPYSRALPVVKGKPGC